MSARAQWASTVSVEPQVDSALAEATHAIERDLAGARPSLVVVFVSPHHASCYDRVPAFIASRFPGALLIGCSAGGVIGGAREIEQRPGLSMTAASLPDVRIDAFHLEAEMLADENSAGWAQRVSVPESAQPDFLLLPDPLTFDAEQFVGVIDAVYPNSRTIGGLASGGQKPGANVLFLGTATHRSGLVGVALSGNIQVDTIVAQGCRPIGEPMFVTKCERNIIWALDGEPPLKVLQAVYERLDARDQELAQHSLFLGVVMKEDRHEYRQGDFLIRNIIGSDARAGALAIGAILRENSVVQFHLRDANTSTADLEELLARYAVGHGDARPQGALLFSCLGRGMHLYGRSDQDTDAFRKHLGDVPLGGFFCNGEIGPVQGVTFLHGYTSSFGLFRSR